MKYVCNKNTNQWITVMQDKCMDVYNDLFAQDREGWENRCKDKTPDPGWFYKFACSDISGGGMNLEIKKKCPKVLPSDKVLTDTDKCNGILKFKCTDDGWVKDKSGSCSDIYRSLPPVSNMTEWAQFYHWERPRSFEYS